jgi:hypothetical protein
VKENPVTFGETHCWRWTIINLIPLALMWLLCATELPSYFTPLESGMLLIDKAKILYMVGNYESIIKKKSMLGWDKYMQSTVKNYEAL